MAKLSPWYRSNEASLMAVKIFPLSVNFITKSLTDNIIFCVHYFTPKYDFLDLLHLQKHCLLHKRIWLLRITLWLEILADILGI